MTCSSSLKFTGGKGKRRQHRGGGSGLYKGGMMELQPSVVSGGLNTEVGGTAYGNAAFGGFHQVSNPATGGVLTQPNAYNGGVKTGGRRRSGRNGVLTRFVSGLRKTMSRSRSSSRRSRRCRRRR